MEVAKSNIIKDIEKDIFENIGIPSIVLMENAAHKVIKNIDYNSIDKSVVVICGRGNNGGDGFAVARNLKLLGIDITVFLISDSKELSENCKINFNILTNLGVDIKFLKDINDVEVLSNCLNDSSLTIDAIFGIGLNRKLNNLYDNIIFAINKNSNYIISIDLPSGMNADLGETLGNCVVANKTVTFEIYKQGFLNYNALKYTGEIIVEKIGFPKEIIDKHKENIKIIEKNDIKNIIPVRSVHSYKGDYGKTLIVAGSDDYTGAAFIATQAAVKSGAGLVTLSTKRSVKDILSIKLSEAMTSCYENIMDLEALIKKSTAIAIGPGMGISRLTFETVKIVIKRASCPIVMDADALNVLENNKESLKENSNIIITPHMGEMSKLTGKSIDYIKNNRIQVAVEFAQEYKVIVLLKGYNTIITDGKKVYVNPTGNSAMASGGMGDCLTGIITSFLSQGYGSMESVIAGAYVHGYVGNILSQKMYSVNANSIIEYLPMIINDIKLS